MTVTHFIWDEQNYLAETDGSNVVQAVYTNEPQQYGNLISTRIGTTTYIHQYDALGSTRRLSDGTGALTGDSWTYDAWGQTVTRTGTASSSLQWVGEIGYCFDTETGLYWMRRRAYNPTSGRWHSADPLMLYGTCFVYSVNSPLNNCDPSGLLEVRIQADAFIPSAWVWFGGPLVQLKGDNRALSASPLPASSSRITSYIVVEMEKCVKSNPKVAGGNALSISTRSFFGVKQTALGTSAGTEVAQRTGPCSVSVQLSMTATIPWVLAGPLAPSIDYRFSLTLDLRESRSKPCAYEVRFTPSGEHDGFPAYELYVQQEKAYAANPVGTPLNLFDPLGVTVVASSAFVGGVQPECCCCAAAYGCPTNGLKPC